MAYYSIETFDPERSLGYLARRIHQNGAAMLEPMFADEGLTGTQWSALVSIWLERSSTCADLARDLAHDKGATTRLVDTLEQRGWVTRTRDTDDRRIVTVRITAAGEAIAQRCRDRVIVFWNGLLEGWDRREVETLVELMQKLRATVDTAFGEGRRA